MPTALLEMGSAYFSYKGGTMMIKDLLLGTFGILAFIMIWLLCNTSVLVYYLFHF